MTDPAEIKFSKKVGAPSVAIAEKAHPNPFEERNEVSRRLRHERTWESRTHDSIRREIRKDRSNSVGNGEDLERNSVASHANRVPF